MSTDTPHAFACIITSDRTRLHLRDRIYPADASAEMRRALHTPGPHLHPFVLIDEAREPVMGGLGYWAREADAGSDPGASYPERALSEHAAALETVWLEWPPDDLTADDGDELFEPLTLTPRAHENYTAAMLHGLT